MKRILPALTLLVLSVSQALSFEAALDAAARRTGVVTAQLELEDARAALGRTEADPLALRPDRVRARQRAQLAEAKLRQARYQAELELATAYLQVLEAEARLRVAEKAVEVSRIALRIAQIRLENGSGTNLDLREAENRLAEAEANQKAAEEGLQVARANLESLLGKAVDALEPVPEQYLADPPPLKAVLDALEGHPDVLQAAQRLELAQLNLELLDPTYAPQAEIASARLQRDQAEKAIGEVRRAYTLKAKQLYSQLTAARRTWQIKAEAFENAARRLALEKQRLAAGLIAEITYRQDELNHLQAELAALTARNDYLRALFQLQAETMVEVFHAR